MPWNLRDVRLMSLPQKHAPEINAFCQYGLGRVLNCFIERFNTPVYAFEYSANYERHDGTPPVSRTRACTLHLIPNTIEQVDDFTEVRKLKPEYIAYDKTLTLSPPICQQTFEYAEVEQDLRVVNRDMLLGQYDRMQKLIKSTVEDTIFVRGSTAHYFSNKPAIEVIVEWSSSDNKHLLTLIEDGIKKKASPLIWLPMKPGETYKIEIDEKRFAIIVWYYMFIIDNQTGTTTVLRPNGEKQKPKSVMFFDSAIPGLSPIDKVNDRLIEHCPRYTPSQMFSRPVCTFTLSEGESLV